MTASTGGPTTPDTAPTEVPEHGAPPPGLPLLDFTNWNLPPPEAPPTRGLLLAPVGQPGIGRSDVIRQAVGPWALAPPMTVPCTPQVAPPLHQPWPSHPATLYQQAVQPPRRSMERGVATGVPSDRAAPTATQPTQDRGRQQARGRGVRGQSASHPGGAQGTTAMFPQLPPREPPSLNWTAVQSPSALTQLCWWQNSAAVGGGRTLSMCSRSIINTTFKPPSGSLNGCG